MRTMLFQIDHIFASFSSLLVLVFSSLRRHVSSSLLLF
jgi:hypothetical protein